MKTNFAMIREEDKPLLIQAKLEVDAAFEASKWKEIAKMIKRKGGGAYDVRSDPVGPRFPEH